MTAYLARVSHTARTAKVGLLQLQTQPAGGPWGSLTDLELAAGLAEGAECGAGERKGCNWANGKCKGSHFLDFMKFLSQVIG